MTDITPNTPVKGDWPGVAAIDVNGDRYCLDCAAKVLNGTEMGFTFMDHTRGNTENWDGSELVDMLVEGQIYTLDMGGVVLSDTESTIMHCGMHSDCENAIPGEEHPYDHNSPVGGRLDLVELPENV